ncbi:MAG: pantoate--beta-alanine ligase [Chloroflexi bacterium RBG_16_64_32]|nr:MAG: pantoate--beta-alanine ligase [Chloroflexi bacterium RBG_16_64_32]
MNVVETVAGMDSARAALSGAVGLVPTMGALHDGHLSLVRKARADSDHVVVSVFVNPTQFGPQEDLQTYPRDMHRDLRLLEAEGVDIVFAPSTGEMYPPGFDEWVEVRGPLTATLEGAFRPQFFRGVTTVVARLLRIVQPHRAYFGEKDAQQLRVVRRMVREQGLPVEIVAMPTVREPDGLAMSSRNAYLSREERRAALVAPRALELAKDMVERGGEKDVARLKQAMERHIRREPLVRIDYIAVTDCETLEELAVIERPALLLLALRVGATRLIDNGLLALDRSP